MAIQGILPVLKLKPTAGAAGYLAHAVVDGIAQLKENFMSQYNDNPFSRTSSETTPEEHI